MYETQQINARETAFSINFLWRHIRLVLLAIFGIVACMTFGARPDHIPPSSGTGYICGVMNQGTETFTSSVSGGISVSGGVGIVGGAIDVDGNQQWTKTWNTYMVNLSTKRTTKSGLSIWLDLFSGGLIATGVNKCSADEVVEIDYEIISSGNLVIPLSIVPAWAQAALKAVIRRTFTWSNVSEYLKSTQKYHFYVCLSADEDSGDEGGDEGGGGGGGGAGHQYR